MKRLLLITLALCLLTTAASAETVLFTADLHYGDGTPGKMEALASLLAEAQTADALLLLGDVTNNGKLEEITALFELLKPAREAGVQILIVPGNHDLSGMTAMEFMKVCAGFGLEEAYAVDSVSGSYAVHVTDGLDVMLLCTALPGEAGGFVAPETLSWAQKFVQEAQQEGRRVLLGGHHPLLSHSVSDDSRGDLTDGRQALTQWLAQTDTPLFLAGHRHIGHWSQHGGLTEILAGKTDLWPLCVGKLVLSDAGIDFSLLPLAASDSVLMQDALKATDAKARAMAEGVLKNTSMAANEAMVDYFASIYRDYVSGQLFRTRRDYLKSPYYTRWQSDEITGILKPWVAFLLQNMTEDYTSLHLD